MRTVAMIAYNFPPDGSAGVHRPLRFVQHLPQMGWHATVISLAASCYERYDPGLLALVPKGTEIIRVPARDIWQAIQAKRTQRLRKKIDNVPSQTAARIRATHDQPIRSRLREFVRTAEAWCYHPDMDMCWIRPAVKATVTLCARKIPDIIYATGGPWSSFVVAQRVSQQTGIPYVLDFRDSWTLAHNEFDIVRPTWARRLDQQTLYELFEDARSVVFRYHAEAECYWRAYRPALEASKIHIIPNGYSGRIDEFVSAEGNKFTVVYAGTLPPYRYDSLLQALQQFKRADPVRASRLRFIFIGDGMEILAEEAAAAGLSEIVETRDTVAHAEVARLQSDAHALLLLGVKPTRGYELCGSKVFSYLKANRPILGIVSPADEMSKVLCRVGISTVADPDLPCEIVAVLRRLVDAWSAGSLASLLPNRGACEVYSAERQTAALARALKGAAAAEPFIPSVAEIPPSLHEVVGQGNWVKASSRRGGADEKLSDDKHGVGRLLARAFWMIKKSFSGGTN